MTMSYPPAPARLRAAIALIDLHVDSGCPGIGAEDFAAIAAYARAGLVMSLGGDVYEGAAAYEERTRAEAALCARALATAGEGAA